MAIYLADQTIAANRMVFPSSHRSAYPHRHYRDADGGRHPVSGRPAGLRRHRRAGVAAGRHPRLGSSGGRRRRDHLMERGLPIERSTRIFKHVQDMEVAVTWLALLRRGMSIIEVLVASALMLGSAWSPCSSSPTPCVRGAAAAINWRCSRTRWSAMRTSPRACACPTSAASTLASGARPSRTWTRCKQRHPALRCAHARAGGLRPELRQRSCGRPTTSFIMTDHQRTPSQRRDVSQAAVRAQPVSHADVHPHQHRPRDRLPHHRPFLYRRRVRNRSCRPRTPSTWR